MLSLAMAMAVASTAQWSCDDEDARVTQHLEDALSQLRSVAPPELSDDQRTARAQLLEGLERYIEARQFPRSAGAAGPVFVDDEDHHCAMGALLAWNGGREIVRHIRATRNLATVPTLANEPGLGEWLTAHGMTVEEAALVQPGYFSCVPAADICWRRGVPEGWLVNGVFPADGGRAAESELSRVGSADGQCAGPPLYSPWEDVPPRTLLTFNELAVSGDHFIHRSWLQCRDPLLITRVALAQPTPADCMRQMIADDPRALLPVCGYTHSEEIQVRRCADDGRYFAENLPSGGVEAAVRRYFGRYSNFDLDDAGVSLASAGAVEAAAWAHSDDGGTVPTGDLAPLLKWSGTNAITCELLDDGGVVNSGAVVEAPRDPVTPQTWPRSQGCSSAFGCGAGLVALLLRRRRISSSSSGTAPRPSRRPPGSA